MKKLIPILILCLLSGFAYSQGKFKFMKESHDFGEVKEGDKATYVFTFENVGNAPIVMSNVRASCGCTTPEWSREPILPGATSKIKAVYNSKGRPGKFYKTITITSNAAETSKKLTISGNVLKVDGATGKTITIAKGNLEVIDTEYNFGKIQKGEKLAHKFKYTNTGKNPINISRVISNCKCVKLKSQTPNLAPGQTGFIELEYTPSKQNTKPERVFLVSNSTSGEKSTIYLKGEVVESFMFKSMLREN